MSYMASRILTRSQQALLLKHKGITLAKPLSSLSDPELDDWIEACKALERMAEQPTAQSAKGRRQFRKMRLEAEAEREGRTVASED